MPNRSCPERRVARAPGDPVRTLAPGRWIRTRWMGRHDHRRGEHGHGQAVTTVSMSYVPSENQSRKPPPTSKERRSTIAQSTPESTFPSR